METSEGPIADKKETKGLGKLWKKFKAAFKNKDTSSPPLPLPASSSRPTSQQPPPKPKVAEEPSPESVHICSPLGRTDGTRTPSLPQPPNSTVISGPETTAEQVVGPSESQTKEAAQQPAASQDGMAPPKTEYDRRLERIHAVFKKHDFLFEDEGREVAITISESRTKAPQERVQKNIRMRVKYTCHNCKTVYGHDRICIHCQHPRCLECSRYPPKRIKVKRPRAMPETAVVDTSQQTGAGEQECACHECQRSLQPGAEECPNCHHKICSICLKKAEVTIATEATLPDSILDSKPEQPQEIKPPEPQTTVTSTAAT